MGGGMSSGFGVILIRVLLGLLRNPGDQVRGDQGF
jgi:hypothetical protein